MPLIILLYFFYAQHVSSITMPIISSSRLWCYLPHWSCRSLFAVCWRLTLQPGHHSNLTAPNLQHTANQERHNQCGKQYHSRELLMMGIVMLETC